MKKLLSLLLAAMLLCASALAGEAVSLRDVTADGSYLAMLTKKAQFLGDGLKDHYRVQQGCATDGTYGYFLLESKVTRQCALFKLNLADWSIVDVRYDLPVDHGNDMTYNANTNQLVVVHNNPNYNTISFIDPERLEVVSSRELPVPMFGLTYCAERGRYVAGISGTKDFVIYDDEFNELARHSGVDTGYINQGSDCDAQYIYFPQWHDTMYASYIVVYDWDGNHINTIKVKTMSEIEDLFHVGDSLYIAFVAAKSVVYEAAITAVE